MAELRWRRWGGGALKTVKWTSRSGKVVSLSPEAKEVWVKFYNEWAGEQANVEGDVAAAFSKLEAYAARFALLHHVVSRVARGEDDLQFVEKESIEAGIVSVR